MTFISGVDAVIGPIVVVFFVAALLTYWLTPRVRRIALRYRIVDRPNSRRVNRRPIARSGGLAVAGTFLAVAGAFLIVNNATHLIAVPLAMRPPDVAALFVGGAAAALLGALDDLFDLRARWQFLGQIVLAAGAVGLGIGIDFVNNPLASGRLEFLPPIAIGFTIFWIVGMINSINWIDGLDGLSSGVVIIAATTLGLISLSTQIRQPLIAVLCFVLAGALFGFLRWNFHPAKIFIGTSGVMFVGYTLAVLSILGTAKVAVALLVLGVPIIDTFWIIVRRLFQGRSPFTPDRQHIHHRLLDLGLSHRQTVLLIYGMCTALAVLALLLTGASQLYAFLGVFIASGLVLFLPTRGDFGRPDELEAEAYEPEPAAPVGPVPAGGAADAAPGGSDEPDTGAYEPPATRSGTHEPPATRSGTHEPPATRPGAPAADDGAASEPPAAVSPVGVGDAEAAVPQPKPAMSEPEPAGR